MYPFDFTNGGTITFDASAETETNVYFLFEAAPFPDNSYVLQTANVAVSTESGYSVEIPSSSDGTYSSFLMYVVEQDQTVRINNVVVTAN
jgi:hypothetical protein